MDQWMTPPDVIELVRKVFDNEISFDPASNLVAQEYVQAKEFCIEPNSSEIVNDGGLDNNFPINCHYDGLKVKNWGKNTFVNPPYSAGNISAFVHRAIYHWDTRDIENGMKQMIMLTNVQSDAQWFHDLLNSCNTILIWRKRIKFYKIFDGKAHEKWEGEKSKELGRNKIGNSPRYLNSLFYWGDNTDRFREVFKEKGTFLEVKR